MKIAFIGGWGHHYLRKTIGESGVSVAVAGDAQDTPAAKRFADAQAVGTFFNDPESMFDTFKPDVVSVGSIYGFNSGLVAQTVERGLPVVSDKPIATSWEQLDALRSLVQKNPKAVILTEFDFRSRPDFRSARDAVGKGLIGEVILATAQKSYRYGDRPAWYADRSRYGGTVLWILSHAIDSIPFVTGKTIERAVGRQGNLSHPEMGSMEDHVAVLMELSGGATAVAHADYLRPKAAASHGDDRLRIAGTRGVVEVRDYRCVLITQEDGETDITQQSPVEPIHLELLAAIGGERGDLYSTKLSLERAGQLLKIRESADRGEWTATAES